MLRHPHFDWSYGKVAKDWENWGWALKGRLPIHLSFQKDIFLPLPTLKPIFSVKGRKSVLVLLHAVTRCGMFCFWCTESCVCSIAKNPEHFPFSPWTTIWKSKALNKVKCFIWIVANVDASHLTSYKREAYSYPIDVLFLRKMQKILLITFSSTLRSQARFGIWFWISNGACRHPLWISYLHGIGKASPYQILVLGTHYFLGCSEREQCTNFWGEEICGDESQRQLYILA